MLVIAGSHLSLQETLGGCTWSRGHVTAENSFAAGVTLTRANARQRRKGSQTNKKKDRRHEHCKIAETLEILSEVYSNVLATSQQFDVCDPSLQCNWYLNVFFGHSNQWHVLRNSIALLTETLRLTKRYLRSVHFRQVCYLIVSRWYGPWAAWPCLPVGNLVAVVEETKCFLEEMRQNFQEYLRFDNFSNATGCFQKKMSLCATFFCHLLKRLAFRFLSWELHHLNVQQDHPKFLCRCSTEFLD